MPLPPYNPNAECPKCGWADADTVYYREGVCVHKEPDSLVETSGDGRMGGERLHRECRCCGHQWDEAPLDAATVGATST